MYNLEYPPQESVVAETIFAEVSIGFGARNSDMKVDSYEQDIVSALPAQIDEKIIGMGQ